MIGRADSGCAWLSTDWRTEGSGRAVPHDDWAAACPMETESRTAARGLHGGRSRASPRRLRLAGFPAPFCPGSGGRGSYPIFCVWRGGSGLRPVGWFRGGTALPFAPGRRLAKGGRVAGPSGRCVGGSRGRVASGWRSSRSTGSEGSHGSGRPGGGAWTGGVGEGGDAGHARVRPKVAPGAPLPRRAHFGQRCACSPLPSPQL